MVFPCGIGYSMPVFVSEVRQLFASASIRRKDCVVSFFKVSIQCRAMASTGDGGEAMASTGDGDDGGEDDEMLGGEGLLREHAKPKGRGQRGGRKDRPSQYACSIYFPSNSLDFCKCVS